MSSPRDRVIEMFRGVLGDHAITCKHADGTEIDDSMIMYLHGAMMGAWREAWGKIYVKTPRVWLAIHDAHEQTVWPCASERAAYERLVQYAYDSVFAEEIPENGEIEEICEVWHELTGTEYMRVVGPVDVFRGDD